MKLFKWVASSAVLLGAVIGGYLFFMNQKFPETVQAEAEFLMLACDYCLHMEVVSIQPEDLNHFVGETVLPYSQNLNVSDYIYEHYSTAEKTFCLSGQLHRHKAFLPLRPDAYKLLVTAISHGKCG